MGKVKPNDKCPCGSSKKYKKCCGHVSARASGANAAPSTRQVPLLTNDVLALIAAGDLDAVEALVKSGLNVNT